MVAEIDAQRIERQVERHPEIAGKVRLRDLQPVRLQVVDQGLAEAAFLAQLRFAGERARGGAGMLGAGPECFVAVLRCLPGAVAGVRRMSPTARRGPRRSENRRHRRS